MTRLPEWLVQAYVDGELEPDQAHALELELVRSREARERVVLLREEADLLRDALQERPRRVVHRAGARAPARGLALGGLPALAAIVAAMLGAGWIFERILPNGFDVLRPLNWIGAYEMVFDLLFWIRDEAPGLVGLVVAVAVTASVSALLTFGVGIAFRRLSSSGMHGLVAVALLVAWAPSPARALDLRFHEETVSVPAGETLHESLVVSGESVYVEGVIEGDLFAFTERLVIRGEVRGDVFAVARSLELTGEIAGSLRGVFERMVLDGRIDRDTLAAGEHLTLTRGGRIERDLTVFGDQVSVDGNVGRHLFSASERFELRGGVGGDADLRGDRIALFDGARVAGDLTTRIAQGEEVERAAGAFVGGEIDEGPLEHHFGDAGRSRYRTGSFWLWRVLILTSAFLVGLALWALVPSIFAGRLETSPAFFRSLGFGAAALLGTPIAIALLALTVVGVPLALIAAGLYATALIAAYTLVGALLGRALLRREPHGAAGFAAVLLLGLVLLGAVTTLPWIGSVVRILGLLCGLGLLVEFLWSAWRTRHPAPAAT